jgi:hypothetical protein
MKIELKNLKINLTFSEETTMFQADVFVDGKKVAYANNDGRGGCTFYNAHSRELRPLVEQAEAYAKTLPQKSYTFGDKVHHFDQTLESLIDDLVYDEVNKKEIAKLNKRIEKDMLVSILCGTRENYTQHFWQDSQRKKVPLSILLDNSRHRQMVVDKLKTLNRNEILNTNLPSDLF